LIVEFNRPIRCIDPTTCAVNLLALAEGNLNLVLHAKTNDQIGLEGSLSIHHKQNDHKITIEVYETTRGRLKRPDIMPDTSMIRGSIP